MLELTSSRKIRIHLSDYQYQSDINHRLIMSSFSYFDKEVLEEILFSPLKISIKKLAKTLECNEEQLNKSLDKLKKTSLFEIEQNFLLIDKKVRRYFDLQILRFDEDFSPNLEFFQKILHHIPVHLLPQWYNIPRTSNNIFESILEKFVSTPQYLQRHLADLSAIDTTCSLIIEKVFTPPSFRVTVNHLIDVLEISYEQLEEYLLFLEFALICCKKFEKIDGVWQGIIIPYQEYINYLSFVHETEAYTIDDIYSLEERRKNDFAFIEDMSLLLTFFKKHPFTFQSQKNRLSKQDVVKLAKMSALFTPDELTDDVFIQNYISQLLHTLTTLRLIDTLNNKIYVVEAANTWLDKTNKEKALFTYQTPLSHHLPSPLLCSLSERQIYELEKCLLKIHDKGWIFFDDFLKGIILNRHTITLKKEGKHWHYPFPNYSNEEKELIQFIIMEWFFICGITKVGLCDSKPAFSLTAFGYELFED